MRSLCARFFAALLLTLTGFALVAWPVRYGQTGIMSFIVSHDSVVYRKNLGPDSAAIAAKLRRFDHDPSWQAVQPSSSLAAAGK